MTHNKRGLLATRAGGWSNQLCQDKRIIIFKNFCNIMRVIDQLYYTIQLIYYE